MRKSRDLKAVGLTWSVVESVSIHESIKTPTTSYQRICENYKIKHCNLASCGIDTNLLTIFMPSFDWTRTKPD